MDNFSWQNSSELDEKILNLEDLLYVLQGLVGHDFAETKVIDEFETYKERLTAAGLRPADFHKIASWIQSAPQELSAFIKSALVVLWIENLLSDFEGATAIACQCGHSIFINTTAALPLTKTFLHFVQQKRNTYWLMLKKTLVSKNDLTVWINFYLECVSDFLQQNIEDLSRLGFRMEFNYIDKMSLNTRQKKFVCFAMDVSSAVVSNEVYCHFNQCSREIAKRDLAGLVRKEIIQPIGKGRGARYRLKDFTLD